MDPRNQTKIPGLLSLWASCCTDHIIPAETEREREKERVERVGGICCDLARVLTL